jgi:hypothetical protein
MALMAMVETKVTYACRLSEEDEQKIRDYIEDTGLSIENAIMALYAEGEIDLYKNSTEIDSYKNFTESDFDTNYIISVEET